mmetsp:Transcript_118813/g.332730  ORF Transcript_118813/g.332730 Transcript_118813/m.332730 type:complete len:151 (+) Transcript_118813:73-525(+)
MGGAESASGASLPPTPAVVDDLYEEAPVAPDSCWPVLTSKPKTEAELRDERYCRYLVRLGKVLDDWKAEVLKKNEALAHADFFMEKIQEVGRVDAERARGMLHRRGIDDQKRWQMQKSYQELKRACGQRVPQFDETGMHVQDPRWQRVCC